MQENLLEMQEVNDEEMQGVNDENKVNDVNDENNVNDPNGLGELELNDPSNLNHVVNHGHYHQIQAKHKANEDQIQAKHRVIQEKIQAKQKVNQPQNHILIQAKPEVIHGLNDLPLNDLSQNLHQNLNLKYPENEILIDHQIEHQARRNELNEKLQKEVEELGLKVGEHQAKIRQWQREEGMHGERDGEEMEDVNMQKENMQKENMQKENNEHPNENPNENPNAVGITMNGRVKLEIPLELNQELNHANHVDFHQPDQPGNNQVNNDYSLNADTNKVYSLHADKQVDNKANNTSYRLNREAQMNNLKVRNLLKAGDLDDALQYPPLEDLRLDSAE
jgi:hypothetical protein